MNFIGNFLRSSLFYFKYLYDYFYIIYMNYDKLIIHLFFNSENKLNLNNLTKYKKNIKYHNTWPRLQHYINNRYNDSKSLKETLYRILYNIEVRPVCKSCGNEVEFIGKGGKLFRDYCCNSCSANSKETIAKKKETQLKNWGTENCYDSEKYQQHLLKTRGAKYIYDLPEVKEKRKQTLINNFGTDKITSLPEIQEKIKDTFRKKYGVENPTSLESVKIKRLQTLKENGNLGIHTSKFEEEAYILLYNKFPDLIRHYTNSEKYPFDADFYIPSLNTIIEIQGSHFHNGKQYTNSIEDLKEIEILKEKAIELNKRNNKDINEDNQYYKIIYVWSDLDVRKREYGNKYYNYLEFYTIDELHNWLNISLKYNKDAFIEELNYYRNTPGKLTLVSKKNNIVKYYQQNNFFRIEKELWKNDNIRNKLIKNRQHYLDKKEFTSDELLRGFKYSGIHYGYSHFNPLLVKWILEKYNSKICYDPCGGWGHHILGGLNIDKYIYNDLSYNTYNQCKIMCKELNINNIELYNNDANNFIPEDDFDIMFTCPPYYNVEIYECGAFNNIDEYNKLIDNIFNIFYSKESCKTLAIVIREDLIENNNNNYIEKYELSNYTNIHLSKNKTYKENLYIYQKDNN